MLLSEQHEMTRDMARAFTRAEIVPHAARWDRECHVPLHTLAKMGALGLMGMCVDPAWGGSGADFVSYVLAVEEIAAGDGGVSNMMCVVNSPICAALQDYGTDAQRERFLRPLASGHELGAFLLTEPQAGSDAANLLTRAERKGDVFVLNGVKQFITSGKSAGIAMIVAVTDPAAGKRGISCFYARTATPGYIVAKVEDKLGHRTCDTAQIVLENMAIPADDMVGAPGEGYKIALAYLTTGRIGVAAQSIGMARAAYEAALRYARERITFGQPLVKHQAIAFMLADMATQIEVARQMTLHAAALRSAGLPCLREASMAKLFASEMAETVCSAAIQIHGGYGYLQDFPVEKIYRDVRVCKIYEGSSEVQKMVIGRELFGKAERPAATT